MALSPLCRRQDELKQQTPFQRKGGLTDQVRPVRAPVSLWALYLEPAQSTGAFSELTTNRLVFAIRIGRGDLIG